MKWWVREWGQTCSYILSYSISMFELTICRSTDIWISLVLKLDC